MRRFLTRLLCKKFVKALDREELLIALSFSDNEYEPRAVFMNAKQLRALLEVMK